MKFLTLERITNVKKLKELYKIDNEFELQFLLENATQQSYLTAAGHKLRYGGITRDELQALGRGIAAATLDDDSYFGSEAEAMAAWAELSRPGEHGAPSQYEQSRRNSAPREGQSETARQEEVREIIAKVTENALAANANSISPRTFIHYLERVRPAKVRELAQERGWVKPAKDPDGTVSLDAQYYEQLSEAQCIEIANTHDQRARGQQAPLTKQAKLAYELADAPDDKLDWMVEKYEMEEFAAEHNRKEAERRAERGEDINPAIRRADHPFDVVGREPPSNEPAPADGGGDEAA
jgi:hypothetical protein